MSAEQNKVLARRFMEEVFNKRNLGAVDELVSDDCIDHTPFPEQGPGRDGIKQAMGMILSAFSDMQMTVEDQVAEGDKVVTRWTARGTHTGDFMGVPPTGRATVTTGIGIDRYQDGKVVESWNQFDALSLMQQLGVIPASEQAPT